MQVLKDIKKRGEKKKARHQKGKIVGGEKRLEVLSVNLFKREIKLEK